MSPIKSLTAKVAFISQAALEGHSQILPMFTSSQAVFWISVIFMNWQGGLVNTALAEQPCFRVSQLREIVQAFP